MAGTGDTYGFGSTFVKMSNFLSDNDLNKIVGVAAGVGRFLHSYLKS